MRILIVEDMKYKIGLNTLDSKLQRILFEYVYSISLFWHYIDTSLSLNVKILTLALKIPYISK